MVLQPAVETLRTEGILITDPRPADTLFHDEARATYDAVLCLYHDQALIPVKTLDFWGGVNTTLGLPVIRTSPDHGTGFDIRRQGPGPRGQPDRGDPSGWTDGGGARGTVSNARDRSPEPPRIPRRPRPSGEEELRPAFPSGPQRDAQDRASGRSVRGPRRDRGRARSRRPDAGSAGKRCGQGGAGREGPPLPAPAGRTGRRFGPDDRGRG